jgi:hypothetical protein
MWIFGGNANEPGDAGPDLRQSSLFCLTDYRPGIGLPGDRVQRPVEPDTSVGSDASGTVLENPGERTTLTPGRTHNRSRSPR